MAITTSHASLIKKLTKDVLILMVLGMIGFVIIALLVWGIYGFDAALGHSEYQLQILLKILHEQASFFTLIKSSVFKAYQFFEELKLSVNFAINPELLEIGSINSSYLPSSFVVALKEIISNLCALLFTSIQMVLVKSSFILLAIPLFLLFIAMGLIDGLSQRAIRTASLGRESTYIFHKSIPMIRKSILGVLGLWFLLPYPINPSLIFVGLSFLLGIVACFSASRFKKYL